jgi:uncharacterized membrane protein SpoIIM required for sporulation
MLENILKSKWLEKKPHHALIIGIIYSIIAIITAYLIFPKSQGIASIAFLSLLLLPALTKIISIEELQDARSKKFSIKKIFVDHSDVLQVYFMLFLGIFLVYAVFSMRFPNLLIQGIFDNQLRILGINSGQATGGITFSSIFSNNLKIMFIFLILSIVFGAGSIFFLAWNASVWGVIFGYIATTYNQTLDAFLRIFIKVMPHMFLEAGAYFFAIVAGGLISQAIIREKINSKKFEYVIKDSFTFTLISLILLILAAFVETYIYVLL